MLGLMLSLPIEVDMAPFNVYDRDEIKSDWVLDPAENSRNA